MHFKSPIQINESHQQHPRHPKYTGQLLSHHRAQWVDSHRHRDAVQRETNPEKHWYCGVVR